MIPPERRSSVNRRLDLFWNLPKTSRSMTACIGGVGNLRTYAAPNLGATRERRERGGEVWRRGEVSTCCPCIGSRVSGGATIAWGGSPYIGSQGGDQPPPSKKGGGGGGGQGGWARVAHAPPFPLPQTLTLEGGLRTPPTWALLREGLGR